MGGRGASSGGRQLNDGTYLPYGSEFRTILKAGNVKFVKQNAAVNAKDPLETMTKGRIYATINDNGEINAISYYGKDGKRAKTINLLHSHEQFKGATRISVITTMRWNKKIDCGRKEAGCIREENLV